MSYGAWSLKSKRFCFGILEDTHTAAKRKLQRRVGFNIGKTHYRIRRMPEKDLTPPDSSVQRGPR